MPHAHWNSISVANTKVGARASEIGCIKKPSRMMNLYWFAQNLRSLGLEIPMPQRTPQSWTNAMVGDLLVNSSAWDRITPLHILLYNSEYCIVYIVVI